MKLIRYILTPFTLLYSFIIILRNYFFDKGINKTEKISAKVISVGNLTLGGAGKTPTVIYLTGLLKAAGVKVGILSRGYRRKSKGYLFVSDGKNINVSVDECGDEMYLLSSECQVPTAVAERRVAGSNKFLVDADLDVIVLDDAYQHRWIHRDLDILIFDQRFLSKIGKIEQNLLPSGIMREPFSAVKRADVVIINRKFSKKKESPNHLNKYLKNKKVFYGKYDAPGFYDLKNKKFYPIDEYRGQKSLVVCGIARPFSFLKILENHNVDITNKLLFKDHKRYSQKEVQKIRKKFYDTNAYSVITTEKDAVKLSQFSKELDDIDIYALKIELVLDEEAEFKNLLKNAINLNNNKK